MITCDVCGRPPGEDGVEQCERALRGDMAGPWARADCYQRGFLILRMKVENDSEEEYRAPPQLAAAVASLGDVLRTANPLVVFEWYWENKPSCPTTRIMLGAAQSIRRYIILTENMHHDNVKARQDLAKALALLEAERGARARGV